MPRSTSALALALLVAFLAPVSTARGEDGSVARAAVEGVGCAPDAALPARLAADAKLQRADAEERAVLIAYYAQRQCAPLWVAAGGLTARGRAVVAEIADADAWGLDAGAFRLPPSQQALGPPPRFA